MNKIKINCEIQTNEIFTGENNKYFYFYKIVNNINDKYYYGVHETFNLYDNYSGSGRQLIKDQKIYYPNNFTKYILKFFNNHKELYDYEKQFVTKEVALNKQCYNSHRGGEGSWDFTLGKVCVKDKDNNMFLVDKDDPRYLSGELVSNMKGLIHVKDKNGNKLTIDVEHYRKNKDKYTMNFSNTVTAIDENGIKRHIEKEEYYKLNKEGKAYGHTKGRGVFIDKDGNGIMCDINDERVLSGELVGYTNKYTIYKYKNDFNKRCFTTKDDPRVISGELVGINYGIIYCRNIKTGEKLTLYKGDDKLNDKDIVTSTEYFILKKKGLLSK